MNIKEAKKIMKEGIATYLEKEDGEYVIPVEQQRPFFLLGPSGIGKTAAVRQVAAELGLGLVAYTMTHHTRQSAMGLPYLLEKEYLGQKYTVSAYTVSEIIASVYELMEKTGKREGILFLDEINCVSETLAPVMLQFLQYKQFGNQMVPEGWVIVTAGNPPQYNKSVREFDVATLDRLRVLAVEEDFAAWKEYAYNAGIHPGIIAFLESNERYFYSVSTTVSGRKYATARGWEDLSTTIHACERHGFEVGPQLVLQYITEENCARKFATYFDLYRKYRMNYGIADVLKGHISDEVVACARRAPLDEQMAIVVMLMDGIGKETKQAVLAENALQRVVKLLRKVKKSQAPLEGELAGCVAAIEKELELAKAANSLSADEKNAGREAAGYLRKYQKARFSAFKDLKTAFQADVKAHERQQKATSKMLSHAFEFAARAWESESSPAMVLFVTDLTVNSSTQAFIARWGCDEYLQYNSSLLVYDQEDALKQEIGELFAEET